MQSEKLLLYDQVKEDLQEKIRRLEEDRHNIDITSGNSSPSNLNFFHERENHFPI